MRDVARLSEYLHRRRYQGLDGWLMDGAAWATFLLGRWQTRKDIRGDVAEIGVHHGKYFILLSLLTSYDERSIAVDVFDQQELNVDRSGKGDRDRFMANFDECGGRRENLIVHAADSMSIRGRDLTDPSLAGVARGSVRIFSVDGSHTRAHTINDIEVAFASLAPSGVVIVDDFYNPAWPGVQEGAHKFLEDNEGFCAAGYGANKLFLVRSEDHAMYYDFFSTTLSEFYHESKVVEIHGRPAIWFDMNDPRLTFDERFERSAVAEFGYLRSGAVTLISGWAERERSGTWITEPRAVARIDLRSLDLPKGPLEVNVQVYPFLHARRPSRRVAIASNFGVAVVGEIRGAALLTMRVANVADFSSLDLEFQADDPDVPAEAVLGSTDGRRVSLFVNRVTFSKASSQS